MNKTLLSHIPALVLTAAAALVLASCSTTSGIPEGDRLYTGLTPITYNAPERGAHFAATQEELEAALATAPNGALFGSSRVRSPFPVGLWIWNAFHDSHGLFAKWLVGAFGSRPVLMSWVNPALRASVGTEVLRAHGYFRGRVTHEIVVGKNPRKAKIAYTVDAGHLFTVDTLRYEDFSPAADSLVQATRAEARLRAGDAFDVSALEGERTRISTLLRNNGFFYYQPAYASYLADTVSAPGRVELRFRPSADIPAAARRKWYVGDVSIDMRRQFMEELHDSIRRRRLTVRFNGRRSPVRPSVVLGAMRLFPGRLYSYDDHQRSLSQLTTTGLFSMVDFTFTPRDTTGRCDTLDLRLNCVFDKPYDVYFEGNLTGKTNNRLGPGVVLGLTKRNAFHGGELLDVKVKGNYEWQTAHGGEGSSSRFNSYEYGFDASLQFPTLVVPWAESIRRRLWRRVARTHYVPTFTTMLKGSSDIISRANYFKRHIVSGEWTYTLQASPTVRHQFSPLVFSFEYMRKTTAAFDSILRANSYLQYTMRDQFVPKMQYVYTYTSPSRRSPLWWQTTVSEAGNLLSLGYAVAGRRWDAQGKQLFQNPYAQFLKLETELVKTWRLAEHSRLVGHVDAGVVWSYGNATVAPYSEQFYVGGANSIRAFTVRAVGPGSYHDDASAAAYYLDQTGDVRLLANLEYRPRLLGSLYGAVFLDAGNVWSLRDDHRQGGRFRLSNLLRETALGTGVGLRYDLDFIVIRLDWGVGLHVPYRSGFYNMPSFRDSQSLHFAIGYPF